MSVTVPRMHWSPVEPSWIVSLGVIVLAVLPHQIPRAGREAIQHPIGRLLFAAFSAVIWYVKPVLGMSLLIMMAGILLHAPSAVEPFAATNLNKERVQPVSGPGSGVHKWFDEYVLREEPRAIQERTENPVMSYDEVVDDDTNIWHSERILHEQPKAIQEKAVGTVPEYDEGGASYGHR